MLRTKIKREILASATTAQAVEEAAAVIKEKREKKKPLEKKILEFILEQLKKVDPIDALAVGGLTVILQPQVLAAESFLTFVGKNINAITENPFKLILKLVDPLNLFIPIEKTSPIGESITPTTGDVIISWVAAFVLAVLVFKLATSIGSGGKIDSAIGMLPMILGAI